MTRIKKKQFSIKGNVISVKELFMDIEGEGINQGFATFFVRLAGCNLRCMYCDTVYSYYGGIDFSVSYIADMILASGLKYVNITGGEPLLQKDAVKKLVSKIKKRDKRVKISIETNGSVDVRGTGADMISMDWKLPGSGQNDKMLEKNLEFLKSSDQIKLVISSEEDMEYAKTFFERKKIRALIIAQPAFGKFKIKRIADFVIDNRLNWKVGMQLHKFL